ncbi:MAG: biopolymer transporter ExbD [Gammaproteobacteria bacterium]|nr:biopolymer transporter ExbD [Gammaproteobacteria bacterium]
MSRKHHYHSKSKEPPELDVTTFLNLMVVLVPFLLITAVFSRITIMELNIPSGAGGAIDKPQVIIEVIVRNDVLELGNGQGVVARIPNLEGKHDIAKLTDYLLKIKENYPDKTDATILIEPDIEYNHMVRIMDAVRSAELKQEGREEIEKVALFPDMSLGEAP